MSHPAPRDPRKPRASDYVRDRATRETGGSELQRVKDELASRGLSPRKRFGQNFLIREDTAERIVEHAHLREDDVAVEIGPGAGALTLRIARRVRHLIAVEKDIGLAQYLREECGDAPRISIVEGDFLEFDLAAAAAEHGVDRLIVVGNIPYNITTPILEHLFSARKVVRSAVLLVQKEYAERLAAAVAEDLLEAAAAAHDLALSHEGDPHHRVLGDRLQLREHAVQFLQGRQRIVQPVQQPGPADPPSDVGASPRTITGVSSSPLWNQVSASGATRPALVTHDACLGAESRLIRFPATFTNLFHLVIPLSFHYLILVKSVD